MNKSVIAIIIAGFFTIFTQFAVRYGYGILLPEMLPDLGITMTQAGIIYSSFFIAYTVFSPVIGLLVDRFNTRIILTSFVTIFGLGTFLMSFVSSISDAIIIYIFVGIGSSACWVPVITLIQRWVRDEKRGTALACADTGSSLGIAITSLLMPYIVGSYDWRAGWRYLGILAMITAAVNFFLVRNQPEKPLNADSGHYQQIHVRNLKVIYGSFLTDKKFWLIGCAYLLMGFLVLVPFTFLSVYAVNELMLSYKAATRLIMIIALAGLAGKLVIGPVSDFAGRIKTIMLCAVLIAAGNIGMAYSRSHLFVIVCTVISGLGYGPIWSLFAASASDYFSKDSVGSIVGFWTLMLGFGSIISPIVNGYIIDVTQSFYWVFLGATLCAVISLVLLLPVLMMVSPGNRSSMRNI